MTDDFNLLQDRLTLAIKKFEENKGLQDVDGFKVFDELKNELQAIVNDLSFLSMVDTDINVQTLAAALSQANKYLKLSKDQYLVCDGVRPQVKTKNHQEKQQSVYGLFNLFARYSPVSTVDLLELGEGTPPVFSMGNK